MVSPVLLSVHDAYVTFGGKALFEELSFNIHRNEKICLVGKNGAGKTTLMQVITGMRELDHGKRWEEPGLKIGYLQQEVHVDQALSVFEFIFQGLAKEKQTDEYQYMVDMVLEPFELNGQDKMMRLSGGQLRRAALARSLLEEPDILLLDEPTNHLDLGGIQWLEHYIKSYKGTVLCISHDRAFLTAISDKVFWLDRGKIKICPKGFGHFEEWSHMLLDQEARELRNRERAVALEVEWASRGVKARRKRNLRRLAEMQKAREQLQIDQTQYRKAIKKIELSTVESTLSPNVIAEFYKVSKSFEDESGSKIVFQDFSMRITKGDRIGIIGKNGSGKTTFLKLLLQELQPDKGTVKLAKNLDVSYFDQVRRHLRSQDSLWRTLCPNGGDYLDVAGKSRHVCGYLKEFMFDPKEAHHLVGTLSGGQKNRLMLAKVLANPGNCLILDEPTNDLDMDTLDMLEELLVNYQGTLFVVSHDRDFLDQTVTKLISFEGDGRVEVCIGGYSDYVKQFGQLQENVQPASVKEKQAALPEQGKVTDKPAKISFKQRYDWEQLPKQIQLLEEELGYLSETINDPGLYSKNPAEFDKAAARYAVVKQLLEEKETLWLQLDELMCGEGGH